MRHLIILIGLAALLTSGCNSSDSGTIELFNGEDLAGWTHELDNPEARMTDVWSVEDGVLKCTGNPSGYIRTLEDYSDYELTLEWRWPGEGGNNGVLVHGSSPRALGIWPKSIEVQLQHQHAGDFWIIGTELDVENKEQRKQDRRHLNLTDDSEKPLGEWNVIKIRCLGDEIKVWVNGEFVNHATNCSVTTGYIALQSEGRPIEYRNIRLRRITD